jgi:trans-aconitate methyltransferase
MPEIKWNAELYDNKHSFVSAYGEDVVGWLHPQQGERILDLGCGTGQLANDIASRGALVTGIDKSPDMIAKAKATYPALQFEVKDATAFQFDQPFDAIFSNATLHWVNEKEKAIAAMFNNLRPGGRLVLEMGGKGNVQSIGTAVHAAMKACGLGDKIAPDFWYFPSLSEYTSLLEQQGFRVLSASHFDRPTALTGEAGMEDWIRMFGGFFFKNITAEQAETVIEQAVAALRPPYFQEGTWYADYVRLRVKAIKPERN